MKKSIFTIIVLLVTLSSKGQDLIILIDGEKIEAKITEVSETEVSYKKWSNLYGPTWVKKTSEIERIKYQKDRLLKQPTFIKGEQWDFGACASTLKQSQCFSGNEIIAQIDLLYANNNWDGIKSYIEGLPSCVSRECIHQYYYEQYLLSCDNENENDIIRFGETYMKTGGEDELSSVLPMVTKLYAIRGDEGKTELLIAEFEHYSKANDDYFDVDIAQLKQETHELLHPYRFEDELIGKWVLLDRINYDGLAKERLQCPLILDINDVSNNAGAHLVVPDQLLTKQRKQTNPQHIYHNQINTSQGIYFDGQSRYSVFQFASLTVKDRRNNTDFVHSALETTRDMRAKMNATIISSKASFEDKLAATMLTAVTTSTLDAILSSMNTSSKTDEVYNIVVYPKTDKVMNALVSHISATTTTTLSNPSSNYNEYVKDKKTKMVKWEDVDNVFFVSKNRQPISLSPVSLNDPLLEEYRNIKRRYSLANPLYLVPLIGLDVAGAMLIKKGIQLDYECFERDEDGNRIPNGHGGYVFDEKKLGYAVLTWFSGGIVILVSSMAIPAIYLGKRDKAYMELNRRNVEKLRNKSLTSISFTPRYDPGTNGIGAIINLNF